MKKMLGYLSLLIVLAMLLAACGGKDNNAETTINTGNSTEITGTEDPARDETKLDTASSTGDADYAGAVLNGTYHNEYFNFRFTPESDWTFYTDDQLLELNELSSAIYEEMAKETFHSRIEEGGSLSVMYASNPSGENVNVVVQKTPETLDLLNEDTYYTYLKTMLVGEYEEMGLSDVSIELVKTVFVGESKSALLTTISSLGMVQMQKLVVGEEYTCILTVSTFTEDSAQEIMGKFY